MLMLNNTQCHVSLCKYTNNNKLKKDQKFKIKRYNLFLRVTSPNLDHVKPWSSSYLSPNPNPDSSPIPNPNPNPNLKP